MFIVTIGCSKHYSLTMTGFEYLPEIAHINKPVSIWIHFSEYAPPMDMTFIWKINNNEEVITHSNVLLNVTLEKPGWNSFYVRVVPEQKDVVTNDMHFEIYANPSENITSNLNLFLNQTI